MGRDPRLRLCKCGGAPELWTARNLTWMPHAGMYHVGIICHQCGKKIDGHYSAADAGARELAAQWNGQGVLL